MRGQAGYLILNRLDQEILEILKVIDKSIRNQVSVLMGLIREKTVPIPQETKIIVYKNADKRCECCGRLLRMGRGDFHVTREPIFTAEPSTLQFLCPTCHMIYGHTSKEGQMQIHRVRQHKSPYWESKSSPRPAEHRSKSN